MTFRFPSNSSTSTNSGGMMRPEIIEIKKIPVVFKFSGKSARDVQLVGSFTNWKEKINMIKQ
jgi:hypothetical protein